MTYPQDPSNNENNNERPSGPENNEQGAGSAGQSGAFGGAGYGYNSGAAGSAGSAGYGQQGYGQQGYPQYGAYQPHNEMPQQNSQGFFSALFDFSFNSFITVRFAKVIYMIIIVMLALYWAFMLLVSFSAFSEGMGIGILAVLGVLIIGGIVFLFGVIMARLTLEFYVSMVRTAQNTGEMAKK